MSKQKIKVVELQIDRGERKFNESGEYIGERQNITFAYGDTMWANHIRNLKHLGITNVEVVAAYGHTTTHKDEENPDKVYQNEEIEVTDDLKKEVAELYSNKKEVKKSVEQQQIDDLKEQIAQLTAAAKTQTVATPGGNAEMDELHKQYLAKFDKPVANVKKNDVEWIKTELAK